MPVRKGKRSGHFGPVQVYLVQCEWRGSRDGQPVTLTKIGYSFWPSDRVQDLREKWNLPDGTGLYRWVITHYTVFLPLRLAIAVERYLHVVAGAHRVTDLPKVDGRNEVFRFDERYVRLADRLCELPRLGLHLWVRTHDAKSDSQENPDILANHAIMLGKHLQTCGLEQWNRYVELEACYAR